MKTLFEKMRANRAKSRAVIAMKREQHYGGVAARSDIERQRHLIYSQARSKALQDGGFGRGLGSHPLTAWN